MRLYYSMSQNLLAFNTPHDGLFLVFDVRNAKYLAFHTLKCQIFGISHIDGNALKSQVLKPKSFFHLNWVEEDEDGTHEWTPIPNCIFIYEI